MNSKSTLTPSSILKDIISTYAELWADVMLGKNLESHRQKVERDIYAIDQLAMLKEQSGKDATQLINIANQLYCLRMIILKKLNLRK